MKNTKRSYAELVSDIVTLIKSDLNDRILANQSEANKAIIENSIYTPSWLLEHRKIIYKLEEVIFDIYKIEKAIEQPNIEQ